MLTEQKEHSIKTLLPGFLGSSDLSLPMPAGRFTLVKETQSIEFICDQLDITLTLLVKFDCSVVHFEDDLALFQDAVLRWEETYRTNVNYKLGTISKPLSVYRVSTHFKVKTVA